MAKSFGNLLIKVLSIFLFVAMAGATLFIAYGYRIDLEDRTVQKTSIIDIVADINGAGVFMDGEHKADKLPYQIKNVVPGIHNVRIEKNGFRGWSRDVKVVEDIVTIIYDVLPVPENLDDYIAPLREFTLDEQIFFSNKYILAYEPGQKELRMIGLFDNGTIKEDNISLFNDDFDIMEALPGEKFLLKFNDPLDIRKDDVYAFISFSDRKFLVFALPEGVERIKVDMGRDYVFFLDKGRLFALPAGSLSEDEYIEDETRVLLNDVTNYEPDDMGNLYYLQAGILYRTDYRAENRKVINRDPMLYKNMAVHPADGRTAMLVLRTEDDRRKLFLINDAGEFKLMTNDLSGAPFAENGSIIYMDGAGHIFAYSFYEEEKTYIKQAAAGAELKGWFGGDGHYLLMIDNDLYLMDVFDKNPTLLFGDFEGDRIRTVGRAFFYVKELTLNVLYFEDAYLE